MDKPKKLRLTPKDWDDVADLLDQCVTMCAESTETHTPSSAIEAIRPNR